jgi:RHS repeat-associated protein
MGRLKTLSDSSRSRSHQIPGARFFGKDDFATAPSVTNLSRYTGKERDTESGNDYFGARYYASTMGRFMSPDWSAKVMPVPYAKLDNPQSLNLYSYVWNNPLSRNDPDGHIVALTCANGSTTCQQDKSTELQRLAANASRTDKNGLSESSLFKATTDKNGNTTMTLDKAAAANFKGDHSASRFPTRSKSSRATRFLVMPTLRTSWD